MPVSGHVDFQGVGSLIVSEPGAFLLMDAARLGVHPFVPHAVYGQAQ